MDDHQTHWINLQDRGFAIVSNEDLAEAGVAYVNKRMKPLHQWWVLCGFIYAWADTNDMLIVRV